MQRIASFSVDHTKLKEGIYISRIDGDITTYDLRFKKPNMGDYLTESQLHTIEHLFATYIRNSEIGSEVIYFGPMGCQTGFYLLVRNANNDTVLKVVRDTLARCAEHSGEIFGCSETECGNYRTLDLEPAKAAVREYLNILSTKNNDFKYEA